MANKFITYEEKNQVFWSRVNKRGPVCKRLGRCWDWLGPTMGAGYGKAGSLGLAHRHSWEFHFGEIPEGLSVLHKCDRMICVNPRHLFIGTQQDNLQDMRNKGHQVRGEDQGSAKVTEEDVLEIRRRYKRYSHTDGSGALAREFGISVIQAYRIALGVQWKHLLTSHNSKVSGVGNRCS